MADFKIYVNAVRVNTKMTQEEWAKALDVDKATICSWEAGKTQPKLDQLRKMSILSGIPMDYIFPCQSDENIGKENA